MFDLEEDISEKNDGRKRNCGRWLETVDANLPGAASWESLIDRGSLLNAKCKVKPYLMRVNQEVHLRDRVSHI